MPQRMLSKLILGLRDLREKDPRFGTDLSQTSLGVFMGDSGRVIPGELVVARLV